jgi:hypothetical protein
VAELDDNELLLSLVLGHFSDSPTRTLEEIIAANEHATLSSDDAPSGPDAEQTQREFGITAEQYAEIGRQLATEQVERMAVDILGRWMS